MNLLLFFGGTGFVAQFDAPDDFDVGFCCEFCLPKLLVDEGESFVVLTLVPRFVDSTQIVTICSEGVGFYTTLLFVAITVLYLSITNPNNFDWDYSSSGLCEDVLCILRVHNSI